MKAEPDPSPNSNPTIVLVPVLKYKTWGTTVHLLLKYKTLGTTGLLFLKYKTWGKILVSESKSSGLPEQ